jgi:hypothetical protein
VCSSFRAVFSNPSACAHCVCWVCVRAYTCVRACVCVWAGRGLQSAFTPAHLVPGIEPSEDKMLQVRMAVGVCVCGGGGGGGRSLRDAGDTSLRFPVVASVM